MTFVQHPEVAQRFTELHPPFHAQAALVEANRCLYCFDAPCTVACPTHIDVPKFIKKIATDNLRGSAATILESNVLGASCARVCPVDVLCEGACVMHLYNKQPIEIGRLQRFAMDDFHDHGSKVPWKSQREKPQRVACIGAGPASLACAAELRRHGFQVTIYDARPLPGGLNTFGVAEYKLRAGDSLREVDFIRSLGVNFRFGVTIGSDLEQLESAYDIIFVAVGLGATRPLNIPGEELEGVVDALTFIAQYKTGQPIPVGRRVAVIGAGNTAIDAANAARRLGAEEVHLLYRRGVQQMSAFPFEFEHAKQEGIQFHWWTQPVGIAARPGEHHVAAIECVRTQLMDSQSIPLDGSNFAIPCDLFIRAIGQTPLVDLLARCRGVSLREGCLVVDRETGQTGNPKYYAGGDCVNGGREVVDAVADGKRAGAAIARALDSQNG
ncbi:MAG TPA: NAD(P)-dependent oxidoreductase [Bryobacteraceae bacterium]|nr:NAD(P)-dependent oxidoreductase [Bryobacteraceae bacterium]